MHARHTDNALCEVARIAASGSWQVVTSRGWIERGLLRHFTKTPVRIVFVSSHPTLRWANTLTSVTCDGLVAVGGGSVIDGAKALIAAGSLRGETNLLEWIEAKRGDFKKRDFRFVAIPTTAGSGSEATGTATLWGDSNPKYSISGSALFPDDILFDARLCLSVPKKVKAAAGLDAISHAFEAIWNQKATSISDQHAARSLALARTFFEQSLSTRQSEQITRGMQEAAYQAGLAIGITGTALAHSISYPLTSTFKIPHGFACALTLGELIKILADRHPSRIEFAAAAWGTSVSGLGRSVEKLIKIHTPPWIVEALNQPVKTDATDLALLDGNRSKNFILRVDESEARQILQRAISNLTVNG
ncbi:iron-containing alcohol dehydrogenase (plasmid) [Agrobacterium sp. rho-8.1]|nr:iron-containing alcohol dehydrogenase [Agrobacterium sp. rho-8.1]